MPPTFLMVRSGRIEQIPHADKWQCELRFAYLDTFLDVLRGKYRIEHIFAYDGWRPVRKSTVPFRKMFGIQDRWERVCEYRGDIGRDSFFLRAVLSEYLGVLGKILMELPMMKYVVGPMAKARRMFGAGDKKFDIGKSQGDGFSTVKGEDVRGRKTKQEV